MHYQHNNDTHLLSIGMLFFSPLSLSAHALCEMIISWDYFFDINVTVTSYTL